MKVPRLSVIMPVHNAGPFLSEAVQSILDQTFRDYEFIIVNDGSTDDSPRTLRDFANKDSRLTVVNRSNGGYSSALNQALGLAQGEFIARMDADDISQPDRLQQQIHYLQTHPDCVAVGSQGLMIDQEGDPVARMAVPLDHAMIDSEHIRGKGGQLLHPSAMIRRDILVAIGGYRTSFEPAEDVDLFLRLAEQGKLANLPATLLQYRLHFGNVSIRRSAEQVSQAWRAVSEACKRRGIPATGANATSITSSAVSAGLAPEMERQKQYLCAAIDGGFLKTARKHAWRILKSRPSDASSWVLLVLAVSGIRTSQALMWARRFGLKRS